MRLGLIHLQADQQFIGKRGEQKSRPGGRLARSVRSPDPTCYNLRRRLSEPATEKAPEVGVLSYQPFLASVGAGANPHDMEAKDLYALGPWNVNSRNPVASEAFLRASS